MIRAAIADYIRAKAEKLRHQHDQRMTCYRDMTFCPFFGDCTKRDTCHRPLTAEVIIAAQASGLPVAQFAEKPECHIAEETSSNGQEA